MEVLINAGELTDGTEYNTGERIAKHELKNTSYEQQKATKEDDRAAVPLVRSGTRSWILKYPLRECNPISTGSSPGHQATREGSRSDNEAS